MNINHGANRTYCGLSRYSMLSKITISFILLCLLTTATYAATWKKSHEYSNQVTHVDRYTTVVNQPTREQRNPLLMTVQVQFPSVISTVGDAIRYLLRFSGYRLVDEDRMEPLVRSMLSQLLPIVVRKLGPMSLQDALQVLANDQVFTLVQDPPHRLVGFKIKPTYQKNWKTNTPTLSPLFD